MSKEELDQYVEKASTELERYLAQHSDQFETQMLLTKYVFSALIDADRTDTRLFEDNKKDEYLDTQQLFKGYYEKLLDKIRSFKNGPDTAINRLRMKMSQECDDFNAKPDEFTLCRFLQAEGKHLQVYDTH